MSEDVKLPTTVEEFQKARREAFVAGARYGQEPALSKALRGDNEAEARRRYPIRRKVPRAINLPTASSVVVTYDEVASRFSLRVEDSDGWSGVQCLSAADIRALGGLADRPFEEVEE